MIKINKTNIFFIMVALVHYLFVYCLCPRYSVSFLPYQKLAFFITQILAFILILLFWINVPKIPVILKYGDENKKFFLKNLIFYFLINIIFLVIVYPSCTFDVDFLITFTDLFSYDFYYWIGHLININACVAYHIIPTIWGISVVNLFLYSLIFAYIITNVKKRFSNKLFWLLYFIFCSPIVLIFSQNVIRLILCSWMFIFLTAFIIFNTNKKINNMIIPILLGIYTGELLSARFEFLPLFILIPLAVYLFKVFNMKQFIIYIFFIILMASFSFHIDVHNQYNNQFYNYYTHNNSFLIKKYLQIEKDEKEKEASINNLEKIYINIKTNPDKIYESPVNEISEERIKLLQTEIFKIYKKYYKNIIIMNANAMNYCHPFEGIIFASFPQVWPEGLIIPKDIIITEKRRKELNNIFCKLTYNFDDNNLSNKIKHQIYNIKICIVLLLLVFLGGLFKKRYIHSYFSLIWILNVLILLLTIPFIRYQYFYGFIFNSYFLFSLYIIDVFSKRQKNHTNN